MKLSWKCTNTFSLKRVLSLLVMGAVSVAAISYAEAPKQTGAEAPNPCDADMKKFCANVTPGEGRPAACLRAYENQLAPACQEHINGMREHLRSYRKACRQDIAKFCPSVDEHLHHLRDCLGKHRKQLTVQCMNAMDALQGKHL